MFAEDRIEYDIEYGGGIVGEGCGDIYGGIIEESMRHLSVLSSQVEEGDPYTRLTMRRHWHGWELSIR